MNRERSIPVPEVAGGSVDAFWLDLVCPSCGVTTRCGTQSRSEGKPCRQCGTLLHFWAAWQIAYQRSVDDATIRDYWADQFGPEDIGL